MPDYRVNRDAVAHAKRLIDDDQYVATSDWGEVQPSADDENAFLKHRLLQYLDKKLDAPKRRRRNSLP